MTPADQHALREALARAEAERDAAVFKMKTFAAAYLVVVETAETEEARALAAEAERDALQVIVLADDAKAIAEYEWERANKLVAERDAALANGASLAANQCEGPMIGDERGHSYCASLRAAEAENTRLKETVEAAVARAEKAEKLAKDETANAEMYARAWVRELGGKLFPKAHHIDACVLTTRWMKERSDRLAVIEADQKAAALVGEYGPSNEMVRARSVLATIPPKENPDA